MHFRRVIMKRKVLLALALCACLTVGCLSGCNPQEDEPAPGGNENFTWTGLDDTTIAVGDQYDVMEGVSVTNASGTDITDKVVVLTLDENEEELTDLGVYDDFEDFNYNITGVYTVYYMVTDGDKTETESREVTVTQQHNIANGDFSVVNNTGFYNWKLDTPGGTATLEKVTENGLEKPKFNISSIGNAWYSLQYMASCNLMEGETYRITVRAKSSAGKSVAFGFENVANNYAMLQGLTAHTLTAEYADYVSYYTADADYASAKAVLYFGYILEEDVDATYDLTIDSIKIEKIERCGEVTFEGVDDLSLYTGTEELTNFLADPLADVSASDGDTDLTNRIEVVGGLSGVVMERTNFTLAYVIENENGPMAIAYRTIVVRLDREHPYSLANGTFNENIQFWTRDVFAGSNADATFEWVAGDDNEGAAKITINTPSTDAWHIQFRQDVTMEARTNYVITVRAKASLNRTMAIELNAGSNNYSYTVNLTTKYTETTIYFSAPVTTTGFRFQMGGGGSANIGSIIWIDSAEITLDPDQTQYEDWQMINPTFAQGMRQWGNEGATFVEGQDANGTYVQAQFASDTDAGWRVQLRQDGKSFEAGVTYKIIIKASSSVNRSVSFEVNPNNGPWSYSNSISLTTEVQTFEFEFTPTENTSGSRVGLLLGGAGSGGTTVNIYQFEIVKVSGGEA